MLMNRIAPSTSDLYTANADGSGERKFLDTPAFDYNATFAADGQSIVFTSEQVAGEMATMKARMGATHFLTKTLPKSRCFLNAGRVITRHSASSERDPRPHTRCQPSPSRFRTIQV
jgi:Tol biopolymer transport system component